MIRRTNLESGTTRGVRSMRKSWKLVLYKGVDTMASSETVNRKTLKLRNKGLGLMKTGQLFNLLWRELECIIHLTVLPY